VALLLCKFGSCYFHIRNIGCIRPFISEDACKMLVNALMTSRLDYGNALLYGITKNTRTKKMDHITPVLIRLHWLLVEYRSQYKLHFACIFRNERTNASNVPNVEIAWPSYGITLFFHTKSSVKICNKIFNIRYIVYNVATKFLRTWMDVLKFT
jgi:hypothetical protein